MKKILTVQDVSCVGQCSLTVALPVISACGIETSVLPSSVLSNHTQFKSWTFNDLTDDMTNILEKWNELEIKFDGFYTGYVSEAQIPVIKKIIEQTGKKGAVIIVDPVMADNGSLYSGFAESFPEKIKELCKGADFILPNITEACLLTETPYPDSPELLHSHEFIEGLCNGLRTIGAKNIILTGVSFDEDKLGFVYISKNKVREYFTKKVPFFMHGTGDLFASVFAGKVMSGTHPFKAAKKAADYVVRALKNTGKVRKAHWYGVRFEKDLWRLGR